MGPGWGATGVLCDCASVLARARYGARVMERGLGPRDLGCAETRACRAALMGAVRGISLICPFGAGWGWGEQEKGIGWMPWRQEAMKDVARCDKPWGAASRL